MVWHLEGTRLSFPQHRWPFSPLGQCSYLELFVQTSCLFGSSAWALCHLSVRGGLSLVLPCSSLLGHQSVLVCQGQSDVAICPRLYLRGLSNSLITLILILCSLVKWRLCAACRVTYEGSLRLREHCDPYYLAAVGDLLRRGHTIICGGAPCLIVRHRGFYYLIFVLR